MKNINLINIHICPFPSLGLAAPFFAFLFVGVLLMFVWVYSWLFPMGASLKLLSMAGYVPAVPRDVLFPSRLL